MSPAGSREPPEGAGGTGSPQGMALITWCCQVSHIFSRLMIRSASIAVLGDRSQWNMKRLGVVYRASIRGVRVFWGLLGFNVLATARVRVLIQITIRNQRNICREFFR